MTGRRLDRLPVTAGQFLTWRFLSGSGWSRGPPHSLSAAPDGRSLRISVQALGDGSRLVASLRPGTRVLVEGSYGRLTARPRIRAKVAFLGAGVGITPLRALAEDLPYAPGDAVLLQRDGERPLFARELDVLAAERGLDVRWQPGHRRAPDSWVGATRRPRRRPGRRPSRRPHPASGLASVTVVGRSLTAVDVDATAAFALGADGERWLATRGHRAAFVVRTDGTTGTL